MKDIIAKRIQELVGEINDNLRLRESYQEEIRKCDDSITAKQGAIFELKDLLDAAANQPTKESSQQSEESNQEKS